MGCTSFCCLPSFQQFKQREGRTPGWMSGGLYHHKTYSRRYAESYDVSFGNPDFVTFAESFGCKGYRIQKTEELIPTLEDAFMQKVPSVIDCVVDYTENGKLTAQLKQLNI